MTPEIQTEPTFCSRCRAEIREADNYCHNCGKSLKPGRGFLFTHAGIILMALILGPLAIPFVWMSKVISPLAKLIYTLVLILIGFYLVYSLVQVFSMTQQSMQMLLGNMGELNSGLSALGSF